MNPTAGIRVLCFMVLFSAIHSIPLRLTDSCKVAKLLNPEQELLTPYVEDQGFTSEILDAMNSMLALDGIPKLNKLEPMNKTIPLVQFYKAFKALQTYMTWIHTGRNENLKNYLEYHKNHVIIIANEIQKALVKEVNFPHPTTTPKSEFERKQFGYKVLRLYKMWLDELKENFC